MLIFVQQMISNSPNKSHTQLYSWESYLISCTLQIQVVNMTNADYGGGDNPELAKKYLQDIIKRVDGLRAIVITDRDGIPVIKVNAPDVPDPVSKLNFLASVSLAVEQAGKLGNGKNNRIICMFNTIQVIHFNKSPLMISLIASSKSNTGILLNLESELNGLVDDLKSAIES
ncbi:hypothetical protein CEXT_173901 [Caerostris extrusa]|uniref:Ragulator complex protein LAMTOR3 n=1 Tax=Caerostris extrusa TaxID=172846 RepID=A0AAV4QF48_CAEEX|nr:hypothetical protein CEXT_173901 [Caerostris extrusa]